MNQTPNSKNMQKIALLIDGDNAQPRLLGKIIAEAGIYGPITIKRIYGDWTTSNMRGWKDALNNYAVQPIQQFRYTVGKNATDSALIIDAMDILHSGHVDGFCIVSSDSDYTRLATRIREAGFFVMGIGEKKTPKAFVNACNIFIFTENIIHDYEEMEEKPESQGAAEDISTSDPVPLIIKAHGMAENEGGWAPLAALGLHLHQLDPSFDPRTFGFKKLSQLIQAKKSHFTLRNDDENNLSTVYVKVKAKKTAKKKPVKKKPVKK
ncbi:MAG: NYN domain-containing protein [Calditrichaeota bacterium]|nr:MAG: NYN domain-containing protein [Calditrichota bacterium]